MAERHQMWTNAAVAQLDELPDVRHDDPLYTWVTRNHSNALATWWPDGAVGRIVESANPQRSYMLVVEHMLVEYEDFAERKAIELPEWWRSPAHVAGEMQALSHRLVRGATNELVARDWARAQGHTVLTTEEAIDLHDEATDETELEEAHVDFTTDDETTWQVKSSKPDEKIKADKTIVVNRDGTVDIYKN